MGMRAGVTGKYDFCHSWPVDHWSTYEIGQLQTELKKSCECGQ
jgi:hypothetical protein